jgi:hypothetical protein
MSKPSLGLGTKLGAAANKSDLNVKKIRQSILFLHHVVHCNTAVSRENVSATTDVIIFTLITIRKSLHILHSDFFYTAQWVEIIHGRGGTGGGG